MVYQNQHQAKKLIQSQIDTYVQLEQEHQDKFRIIKDQSQLDHMIELWENNLDDHNNDQSAIGLIMLLEGAEAVDDIEELNKWWDSGVRIIGPVWAGTKYCGGTKRPGAFTQEGFRLLDEMSSWGYILDVSHMSERSMLEAIDYYDGNIIASHANAKNMIKNVTGERHLTDEAIKKLSKRGGVIGVIPFNKFLDEDWHRDLDREFVKLDLLIEHIDHICQITGSDAHVGIGTDFDGGFGYPEVPYELNSIADIQLIAHYLEKKGFNDDNIKNIMGYNWIRKMKVSLPCV